MLNKFRLEYGGIMDKRTLKSLIIELRDIDGKSFREISDTLALDHDIHMTRQAVCGMYKRATNKNSVSHNRDLVLSTTDIVNYFAIGKDDKEIKTILQNHNVVISNSEISRIINENQKYIIDVKQDQLNIVKGAILSCDAYDIILNKLTYKEVKPSDGVINNMIKLATASIINDRASDILARVYVIKEDKSLIKDFIGNFKLSISYTSISKHLN